MQNQPLLLSTLLRHADRFHHSTEIVSRTVEGPIHRYGYGDAARRARKLADALEQFGVGQGDRVATLAWNTFKPFRNSARCYRNGRGMARHQPPSHHIADLVYRQSR